MNDEPILELPQLTESGTTAPEPGDDALSLFELPPLSDAPVPDATKVTFELPPGFGDLDLPLPGMSETPSFEPPPLPLETEFADRSSSEGATGIPEIETAVVIAEERHPIPPEAPGPVMESPAAAPPMPAPEPFPAEASHPVEPPDVETEKPEEPTVFHPDGSLEHLVEALERTLPKPSSERTTLRCAARAGKRYLRFALDNRPFLIDADRVREIGLVPQMTFLPRTPDWVRGLTNLRGEMLSVVDLRRYLGLGESVPDPFLNRLVVVTTDSGDLQTGLIVDRVDGFARVEETALLPLPERRDAHRHLAGAQVIEDEVAALLDIDELLNAETFRQLDFA